MSPTTLNMFFRVISTILPVQIVFYSVGVTLFLVPFALDSQPVSFALDLQSLQTPIIVRAVSILVFTALPTFTRALLKNDMTFVMFHFIMLNLTIFSSFVIYCELPRLSIHIWTNNFIDVVPKPLTGSLMRIFLVVAPVIFLLVELVFYGIVTNPYSGDLGYYGRFHRGLWAVLGSCRDGAEGFLICCRDGGEGFLICCRDGGEDLGSAGEDPGSATQALSPPPYFVSALPSISFAAHQDHITQYALAADTTEVFRNDEKIM
jgi:hypothetical protein